MESPCSKVDRQHKMNSMDLSLGFLFCFPCVLCVMLQILCLRVFPFRFTCVLYAQILCLRVFSPHTSSLLFFFFKILVCLTLFFFKERDKEGMESGGWGRLGEPWRSWGWGTTIRKYCMKKLFSIQNSGRTRQQIFPKAHHPQIVRCCSTSVVLVY